MSRPRVFSITYDACTSSTDGSSSARENGYAGKKRLMELTSQMFHFPEPFYFYKRLHLIVRLTVCNGLSLLVGLAK
jgi:hypothetical protein